jgi:acyl-CoA thioesterase FadM
VPEPDGRWMEKVARNATDGIDGFLTGKRYMITDRDSRYTKEFRGILHTTGGRPERRPSFETLRGWTSEKYREYGVTWVARSHEIRYKHASMQDDALVVRTWVESSRPASCLRKYEVTRSGDGKLLAEAMTEWAYVDLGSGRPKRVPDELAAAFKAADD